MSFAAWDSIVTGLCFSDCIISQWAVTDQVSPGVVFISADVVLQQRALIFMRLQKSLSLANDWAKILPITLICAADNAFFMASVKSAYLTV